MYDGARQWVADQVAMFGPWPRVCEVGSRFINGTVRDLFKCDTYVGVDILGGGGVDVVADFTTWQTIDRFDCVVCCETFEHTAMWPVMVSKASVLLVAGGALITTAAGPGWPQHSAVDGGALRPDEHYENVDPDQLRYWLTACGFVDVVVDVTDKNVRSMAKKGG